MVIVRYNKNKLDLVFYEIKEHVYNRLPNTRLQSTSLRIVDSHNILRVKQMYSFNPSFIVYIGTTQKDTKIEGNMWVIRRLHGFCDRNIDGMIFSILHEIGHIYDDTAWGDLSMYELARKTLQNGYKYNEITQRQAQMNYRSWEIEQIADKFAIEEIATDRKFYEELSKFLTEVE